MTPNRSGTTPERTIGGASTHRSTATGRVATPSRSAQHSRSSRPRRGDQLAGEGYRPHGKAGPAGDRQREIEARPKREREIAESVAPGVKPADTPSQPRPAPARARPATGSRETAGPRHLSATRQGGSPEARPDAPRRGPGRCQGPEASHRAGRQTRRKQQRRHAPYQRALPPKVPPRTLRRASSS